MTESDGRTLGRLEAHVADLRQDVRNLEKQVAELVALVERGRGAKFMFAAIASAFGGAGSLAAAWFSGLIQRGGN